jgi:hypothetical protein
MRITVLAVAMLLALGAARTTLGQAPASAKNLGITAESLKSQSGPSLTQRRMATQAAAVAERQFAEQQAVAFDSQVGAGSQANTMQQVLMLVPQQLPDGQQAVFIVPQQQPAGGDIQLAGHHQFAGGCPCNQQYGGPWAGGYGGPWAGGYGGPFAGPNMCGGAYGYGHPGQPWSGGHYGPWGGAHHTPGYPHHHMHREYVGPQGPPTAQVAYPYYTVRGPRDFFIDNPPSIGR